MDARVLAVALVLMLGMNAHAQESTGARSDRVAMLIARGDARHTVGDTLSALGYYRDAIAAGPRRREGYLALGAQYVALGEPARALEVYEAALRAQVHSEFLVLAYSHTLEALGQQAEAREALRRWVQQQPDSGLALAALAALAEARGAYIEALAARRGALAALLHAGDAQAVSEARTKIRALEHLLGGAERVRSTRTCGRPIESTLTRALARCP